MILSRAYQTVWVTWYQYDSCMGSWYSCNSSDHNDKTKKDSRHMGCTKILTYAVSRVRAKQVLLGTNEYS